MSELNLKSIFKRDDLRGIWPKNFNSEVSFLAGRAFCRLLKKKYPAVGTYSIVIGYDARLGSEDLAEAMIRGIRFENCTAVLLGMVSSEQVYFACGHDSARFVGGAMITASHNPADYNGVKFVYSGALPLTSADLMELQTMMQALFLAPKMLDISHDFVDYMLSKVDFGLPNPGWKRTVKVVIAAGNGVGGVAFMPFVKSLEKCGFCFEFLDCEPDGRFPKGVPNPLLRAYMDRLSKAVLACGADLGIGFDGDADRAGFVDNTGKEVIPAHVFSLIALRKLVTLGENKTEKKSVVMRNLCCSRLIYDLFAKNTSVELVDTPVGHGRIKLLMRHPQYNGRMLFAGEHSGHYFYPEFYSVDSGMLTALNLMAIVGDLKASDSNLASELTVWRKKYNWSGEINYEMEHMDAIKPLLVKLCAMCKTIPGAQRYEVHMDPVLKLNRVFKATSEYNPDVLESPDLKIVWDDGASGWWFVARPSGNEPKLRLNIECWGNNAVADCIEKQDYVDTFMQKNDAHRVEG
ncbi:MAG: hypothetical protein WCS73_01750 [Lentisphaeria bacterium]